MSLYIGQRVKVDRTHDNCSIYNESQLNQEGVIIREGLRGWYGVRWDDGDSSRNYHEDMLIPIETTGVGTNFNCFTHEDVQRAIDKYEMHKCNPYNKLFDDTKISPLRKENIVELREGMRVIPNPNHENYPSWNDQHKLNGEDCVGTIIEPNESGWWSVEWDNGNRNSYRTKYLIPLDDIGQENKEGENVSEDTSQFDRPYLPGMRMCLNPEWDDYEKHNAQVGGTAGYVIGTGANDEKLRTWLKHSLATRKSTTVRVRFDNGAELNLYMYKFLPIDAPIKNITKIKLNNGDTFNYVEGDVEEEKILDDMIFNRGYNIIERKDFDDEWRKSIMDAIENQ